MRFPCILLVLVFAVVGLGFSNDVLGQSSEENEPSIAELMVKPLRGVDFEEVPAREAFKWWARATNIPLVIQWEALEGAGIDSQQPITLKLNHATAASVLSLMLKITDTQEQTLLAEITPWWVRVMTKEQANAEPIVRIYEVMDLTHPIPNFDDAPSFDLSEALSSTNEDSSSLFGSDDDDSGEVTKTRSELGQELAETVRATIEPDLWLANGGTVASVRYIRGYLIVKAPIYVHQQLGFSSPQAAFASTAAKQAKKNPGPPINQDISGVSDSD